MWAYFRLSVVLSDGARDLKQYFSSKMLLGHPIASPKYWCFFAYFRAQFITNKGYMLFNDYIYLAASAKTRFERNSIKRITASYNGGGTPLGQHTCGVAFVLRHQGANNALFNAFNPLKNSSVTNIMTVTSVIAR